MRVFPRKKLHKLCVIFLTAFLLYLAVLHIKKREHVLKTEIKDRERHDGFRKVLEEQSVSNSSKRYKKNTTELFIRSPNTSLVIDQVSNDSSVFLDDKTHRNRTIINEDQLPKTESVNSTSTAPENQSMTADGGGLQVRLWRGIVFPSVKSFCEHPLFPKGPNERSDLTELRVHRKETVYAQQIFGYLHPSVSGLHRFAVASDDNSVVWLREYGSKENPIKLCSVEQDNGNIASTLVDEFDKYPSQKSKPIYLEKGKKYFLEVLHIQIWDNDGLQVMWLQPGETIYTLIDYKSTSQVDEALSGNRSVVNRDLFRSEACRDIMEHHHLKRGGAFTVEKPLYVEHSELENALPACPYRPDYLNRYGPLPKGKWLFLRKYRVETHSYPWTDYPRVLRMPVYKAYPLEYTEAESVVKEYMDSVEKKYSGIYKLGNIVKVEKKPNNDKGARYLVEFNVTKSDNHSTVISEYIYKNATSKKLCYPEHFQWERNANIAIILTLRNQGNWMRHFLDNLEEIYVSSGEQNVSLVVFDYQSSDIDIEGEMKVRHLPLYTIIKQPGVYSRCHSINTAVKAVKDPRTIVFTLDLHLEIPNTIFDDVRKHCFEGRSVYTPIIVRLRPGHTPLNPFGVWEQQGFGLIAMYKSDWDRVGGLDEETFKNKWGGEDWELMERVVGAGLEYERVHDPKMFHYHHSRKGMWTGDGDIQNNPFSS